MKNLPSIPTVTIGIPARNEANNLTHLISALLTQELDGFSLEKIVVISDGSTDRTVQAVQQMHKKLVSVKEHPDRKGKPARINELMSSTSSDILVLIDADVQIREPRFIADLIAPMKKNQNILLTSGLSIPLPPKTTVEHIVRAGVRLWDEAKRSPGMSMMYRCEGQARAMKKKLYRELKFPMASADDVYPFLFCESKGYGFAPVDTAIVYFRLPQTFKDYIKQMNRFLESQDIQSTSFGRKFIKMYYTVTSWTKLKVVSKHILRDPLWISLYLLFLAVPKFLSLFHAGDRRGTWEIIQTTKQINQ